MERIKSTSSTRDGGNILGSANELDRNMYQISYGKGIEGRGRYTEQVEIIGRDVLKSTLKTVYTSTSSEDSTDGREMLRPAAMAQMSPRMFWSLVYHCRNQSNIAAVEDMLFAIMTELDWSHLKRGGRKRTLSEKAKENLRQEQLDSTQNLDAMNESNEDGVRALQELEDTLLNSLDGPTTEEELRKKRLEALTNKQNDNWVLITPEEEDEDELRECIQDGQDVDYGLVKLYSSILMKVQEPPCKNWRQLANVNAEALSLQLHRECHESQIPSPSIDTLQNWINAAQLRSLEEIMLTILDSDERAFHLLEEKAHSCNPWDLSQWSSYPELLWETLDCEEWYSVKDVGRWIDRAKIALGVCVWLEDYSVSVV
jgi:hypothetical protein